MEQTFNDLCNERKHNAEQGLFGFVLWMFIETTIGIIKEHLILIKKGKIMENIITNHKSSAIVGLLLAMPLAILLLIEMFDIEPLSSFFKALTTEADGYRLNAFGAVLTIGALLLLPLGFIISLVPVVRNVRAGNGFTANPVNLLIAVALFIFIARLIIGFIIDQYPCWIGVPNCD
ncbi:MAG: hypothetical protein M3R14_08570 [Acidobacteriota bacterium]|nr:hypothetical protein [Acidobacteriota bacterium]